MICCSKCTYYNVNQQFKECINEKLKCIKHEYLFLDYAVTEDSEFVFDDEDCWSGNEVNNGDNGDSDGVNGCSSFKQGLSQCGKLSKEMKGSYESLENSLSKERSQQDLYSHENNDGYQNLIKETMEPIPHQNLCPQCNGSHINTI